MTMQEPVAAMDGVSARQRDLIRGTSLFADLEPAVPLLIISRCIPASFAPNSVNLPPPPPLIPRVVWGTPHIT
jgi:hypothetical protein